MGRLNAGQAIAIAKQVCDGLGEAHNHGVVHRDLKPQNVMVDDEGSARIMDFGIARAIEGKKQGQVLNEFLHGWLGQTELALRNLKEPLKTEKGVEKEAWVEQAYMILGWIHLQGGEIEESRKAFKNWFDYVAQVQPDERGSLSFTYDRLLCGLDLKQGRIEAA